MCRLSATLSVDVLWLGRTCLKTRNANRNVSIGTRDRRIAAPAHRPRGSADARLRGGGPRNRHRDRQERGSCDELQVGSARGSGYRFQTGTFIRARTRRSHG